MISLLIATNGKHYGQNLRQELTMTQCQLLIDKRNPQALGEVFVTWS
jgi:hypothetical protein